MSNFVAAVAAAETALAKANRAAAEYRRDCNDRNRKLYLNDGGCNVCWGEGKYRHYYTLDIMGDYDTKPCGCNSRRFQPFTEAERLEYERLEKAADEAETALEKAKADAAVEKGRVVRVVKGRKVPIGTEGAVFWIGSGQWGYRVGLKDRQGNTHWTALDNVQVIAHGLTDNRPANQKPQMGSRVTYNGKTGHVFWMKNGRLGFKGSDGIAVWANVSEAQLAA